MTNTINTRTLCETVASTNPDLCPDTIYSIQVTAKTVQDIEEALEVAVARSRHYEEKLVGMPQYGVGFMEYNYIRGLRSSADHFSKRVSALRAILNFAAAVSADTTLAHLLARVTALREKTENAQRIIAEKALKRARYDLARRNRAHALTVEQAAEYSEAA